MRLSEHEIDGLRSVLQSVDGEVFLFGSRVDNTKRGGDIDIIVISERDDVFRYSLELEGKCRAVLDQKVDIQVFPKYEGMTPRQRNFFSMIQKIPLGPVLK